MTAANSNEPSWAEQKNADMHIYLSNTFTRTFEESVGEQPDITLRDLYYNLARTTSGSHVMVYNEGSFGNLYQTRMTDFLP
ncbi:MAG: C13 family peptidase [Alloprevotella sp.]|nr:C13 family peptidase [Alloprevotella sp.]